MGVATGSVAAKASSMMALTVTVSIFWASLTFVDNACVIIPQFVLASERSTIAFEPKGCLQECSTHLP